jgi:hypothetical protein
MEVDALGVVIAAIAGWVVGAIWYGVLGKRWKAALGRGAEDIASADGKPPVVPMVISFVAELIMALLLGMVIGFAGGSTEVGAAIGAACWLGFIATTITVNNAYQGRSLALTLIDGGHWLVVLIVQGAILGSFG